MSIIITIIIIIIIIIIIANNNNNDNNILIHWIKLQIVSSGDTLWPYEAAISEKRTNSSHSF